VSKRQWPQFPFHLPNNVEQLRTYKQKAAFSFFKLYDPPSSNISREHIKLVDTQSQFLSLSLNEIVDRPSVTSFGLTHMSRVQVRRYLTLGHIHTQLHSLRLLDAGLWHTKECGALFFRFVVLFLWPVSFSFLSHALFTILRHRRESESRPPVSARS
jgi:hypothetical protein